MKFYKKISPQIRLQLASGRNLQFENVDGTWGVHKSVNPEIQAELAACIRNEIGGVTEITEAEYTALVEKKTTSPQVWREELTRSGAGKRPPQSPLPTAQPVDRNAVVNAELKFPAQTAIAPDRQPIVPVEMPAYKPTATPRT